MSGTRRVCGKRRVSVARRLSGARRVSTLAAVCTHYARQLNDSKGFPVNMKHEIHGVAYTVGQQAGPRTLARRGGHRNL